MNMIQNPRQRTESSLRDLLARTVWNSPCRSLVFAVITLIAMIDIGYADATLSSDPMSLFFPDTVQTVTATEIDFQVTNGGVDDAIISSFQITGAAAGDFSVTVSTANIAGSTTETWALDFTPSAPGPRTATLEIDYNWLSSGTSDITLNVPLSGTGLGANVVIDASSPMAFGQQQVNTSSSAFIITVTNDGNVSLFITGVSKAPSPGCANFNVPDVVDTVDAPPALDSATVSFTFSPMTRGAMSCDVTIANSDLDTPNLIFSVTGSGVGSELQVGALSLSFGDQRINTTQIPSQLFTLSNVGDPAFDLTVVTISIPLADNDEDWVLTLPENFGISPGGSESVIVEFHPVAIGNQNATIDIVSDADVNSTDTIAVTGDGVTATIALSPNPLTWPSVAVNTTIARSLQIANTGGAPLTISEISLSGPDAGQFSITSVTPPPDMVVDVASSLPITIHCTPTSGGPKTASVEVISDADNGSSKSSTLICNGVDDSIFSDGFESGEAPARAPNNP